MTHRHKKKCELCEGISTYSHVNTATGNREMYLCQKAGKGCSYAEPITNKY